MITPEPDPIFGLLSAPPNKKSSILKLFSGEDELFTCTTVLIELLAISLKSGYSENEGLNLLSVV